MNCKDMSELFTAYLEDQVTAEEHEQIQAHLSTCPRCREELEALAVTQSRLRQALKVMAVGVTPSAQAWAGLRQRLEVEGRPRLTIFDRAKSKVAIMIRGLGSPAPAWKPAIGGALVVALIAGLIALPSLTGQTPEALAAQIARNSPYVQAALRGEEGRLVKMVEFVDQKGTLIFAGEGGFVTVVVDLATQQVIEVIPMYRPEMTAADEQEAINIAKADPRVQELLEQGASISRVLPFPIMGMREVFGPDGESLHREATVEPGACVGIKLGEERWYTMIHLAEGKVLRVGLVPGWARRYMDDGW